MIDGWLQGVHGSAKTANTFFVLVNLLGERVIVSKGFIIPELEAADLKLSGSDLEGSLLYIDSVPDLHPPREGNGTPLQYSCLENPMDRGAR